MAKRRKDRAPEADPADQSGSTKADFPIHEPIGRTLKALFDEVTAQPVPEKLRELLRQLEQKESKD